MSQGYVLVDLERSGNGNGVFFWKYNEHGYVREVRDAKVFSEDELEGRNWFDRNTLKVPREDVMEWYYSSVEVEDSKLEELIEEYEIL